MTNADKIEARVYGEWICLQKLFQFILLWKLWRDSFWRNYRIECAKMGKL